MELGTLLPCLLKDRSIGTNNNKLNKKQESWFGSCTRAEQEREKEEWSKIDDFERRALSFSKLKE